MTDDRSTVAFADGKHLTFNTMAPTRTQNVVGVMITRQLMMLGIGITGCGSVWITLGIRLPTTSPNAVQLPPAPAMGQGDHPRV